LAGVKFDWLGFDLSLPETGLICFDSDPIWFEPGQNRFEAGAFFIPQARKSSTPTLFGSSPTLFASKPGLIGSVSSLIGSSPSAFSLEPMLQLSTS
jgi:hypothetical protein